MNTKTAILLATISTALVISGCCLSNIKKPKQTNADTQIQLSTGLTKNKYNIVTYVNRITNSIHNEIQAWNIEKTDSTGTINYKINDKYQFIYTNQEDSYTQVFHAQTIEITSEYDLNNYITLEPLADTFYFQLDYRINIDAYTDLDVQNASITYENKLAERRIYWKQSKLTSDLEDIVEDLSHTTNYEDVNYVMTTTYEHYWNKANNTLTAQINTKNLTFVIWEKYDQVEQPLFPSREYYNLFENIYIQDAIEAELEIEIDYLNNPQIIDFSPLTLRYTINSIYNPPVPETGNIEVIDLAGLMLNILSMPWTFISTAFNVTIFEGTPYAINFSNIFKGLIAILTLLFIIRLFTNGFNAIGNIASSTENRKNTKADTELKKAQTKQAKAKTAKIEKSTKK